MNKFRISTLLIVGLTAVIVTAPAGAGEQLTKKEFQKEANAICEVANDGIEQAFIAAGFTEDAEPTLEQQQAALAGAVPVLRGALDEIGALQGPSAYQKKVDKLLDRYNDVIDGFEADPLSAFDEDGPDPFARADKQAKKLGLKECVQSE